MLKFKNGFSLIELLVALSLGMILMFGLLTIYSSITRHSKRLIASSELRQTLQAAMNLISDDVRRAGFWVNAKNDVGNGVNTNPYMVTGTTDIYINEPANNCILLTYNATKVAPSGAIPDSEKFGFRLVNNAIQFRPLGKPFNCNAVESDWDNITDSGVMTIDTLSFTHDNKVVYLNGGSANIIIRNVAVTISGHLVNEPSIATTITKTIRVRNSKFVP